MPNKTDKHLAGAGAFSLLSLLSFPRAGVGTHGSTRQRHLHATLAHRSLHSHAGAWERGELSQTLYQQMEARQTLDAVICGDLGVLGYGE